jgi:hypothetical protein
LPFALQGGPPIVINPPPVVVNPQPDNQPGGQPGQQGQPAQQEKVYVYSQSTGELKLDNQLIGKGYSGKGKAKNSPKMQSAKKVGPIPADTYLISRDPPDPKTGEPIIGLLPVAGGNLAAGRFPVENFTIHGDSNPPGNAGESGIVMPRDVREKIDTNGFNKLKVIP